MSLTVTVTSEVGVGGTISLAVAGTPDPAKRLDILWISGLALDPASVFSLPGGAAAGACAEGGAGAVAGAGAGACWAQQQDVVIVRGAGVSLASGDNLITWTH